MPGELIGYSNVVPTHLQRENWVGGTIKSILNKIHYPKGMGGKVGIANTSNAAIPFTKNNIQ